MVRTMLVTGARGMLGTDLRAVAESQGWQVLAPTRTELDITDPVACARIAAGEFGKPQWVVNCAAYTAVDLAESHLQEAVELNTLAPAYLSNVAGLIGARFLHLSTDFVFAGTEPRELTEDDPTAPLGVYGRSKRDGEAGVLETHPAAVVVRTAWLFGPHGNCFPRTMIRLHLANRPLRVVADQHGNPTYTVDLAHTLLHLIGKEPPGGIYHAAGPETTTWHDFAERAIEAWTGVRPAIEPISTEDYPTPAKRPKHSALATQKLRSMGIPEMRPLNEALADFCLRLKESGNAP
jgi:dTDP-4-dehydrorhamnose reductase